MRRPYSASEFEALVREVKREIPGVAITTDVIVGFPGETTEHFEESLRFVENLELARVHAFPFSPRPGTEAASLPDAIPHAIKRQRMSRMLGVADRAVQGFAQRHLGTEVEVLWESCRDGFWYGTSDNYIRVHKESAVPLANQLRRERLLEASDRGVRCQPILFDSMPGHSASEKPTLST